MTKQEYSHSVRDLLGTHFDSGHALPQDPAGGEGFSNAAEAWRRAGCMELIQLKDASRYRESIPAPAEQKAE